MIDSSTLKIIYQMGSWLEPELRYLAKQAPTGGKDTFFIFYDKCCQVPSSKQQVSL